ncbi:hypothetical protein, partial [Ruminococcus sp.]|uniref:hypothetical protein n=1 Tax=Ruminococcus sp. TaxID=41978 RepID=UPI0038680727
KIWSTFFKGCGCGQSPQYFRLRKFFIAKQLAVWRLEHNSESLIIAIATQKHSSLLFINEVFLLKACRLFYQTLP